MAKWKDGKTTEQVARDLLRDYLIRCHRIISEEYPEVQNMEPVNAADYLLHLRDTGRIDIRLYKKSAEVIGCRITELQPEQADCADGKDS
jgi:hypothetical protein